MSASAKDFDSPVVFLLHGWGVDSSTLEGVRTHVSKYYETVALELPGFGGVLEPETPWGVEEYARNAARDISRHFQAHPHTPKRAILFGHSFGGRIIIKMLGDPKISSSLDFTVEKCIITGGAGIKPARDAKYHAKVGLYKLSKKLLPKAAVAKIAARNGSEDYNAASENMRATFIKVVNEDLTPLLPHVKPETLLIWGELDDATPLQDGETMEKLMPNAGLAKIAGAGHYAFLEKPGVFYSILDAYLGKEVR
jgi:pimeloyl-ACP methyl ester carboxylesterase